MMQEEHHWLLKHIATPVRDLPVIVKIDHEKQSVELVSERFDSWLIGQLVVHSLPVRSNIVAFFDSSRSGEPNVYTTWRITYVLAGVRLACEVGRIFDYARKREDITVLLGESKNFD
jgi:hypothetical protein